VKNCANCEYWKRKKLKLKNNFGNCKYEVIFPESVYARSPGLKQDMRSQDGNNCKAFNRGKTC